MAAGRASSRRLARHGAALVACLLVACAVPSGAAGWTWPEPFALTDSGSHVSAPVVAENAVGNAVAIFAEQATRDGTSAPIVRAAIRTPDGRWSAPVDLSLRHAGLGAFADATVLADGTAVAVWEARDEDGVSYVETAEHVPGAGWGVAETISPPSYGTWMTPRLVTSADGTIAAGWDRKSHPTTTYHGEIAIRAPDGQWSSPQGAGHDYFDMAFDAAGDLFMAWNAFTGGDARVQARVRSSDGAWGPFETVFEHSGGRAHVVVDALDRVNVLSFSRGLLRRAIRAPDGSWSEQPSLAAASDRDTIASADVVRVGARLLAAWVVIEYPSGPRRLFTAELDEGGEWSAPAELAPAGSVVGATRIAVSDLGDAVLTWLAGSSDGAVSAVGAAVRDRTGAWGEIATLSRRPGRSFLIASPAFAGAEPLVAWLRVERIDGWGDRGFVELADPIGTFPVPPPAETPPTAEPAPAEPPPAEPAPAPAPPTAEPQPAAPSATAEPPPAAGDAVPPRVTARLTRSSVAALVRRGVTARVRCGEACAAELRVELSAPRGPRGHARRWRVAGRRLALRDARPVSVRIRLGGRAARRLARARGGRLRLRVVAVDAAGNRATAVAGARLRR